MKNLCSRGFEISQDYMLFLEKHKAGATAGMSWWLGPRCTKISGMAGKMFLRKAPLKQAPALTVEM
eukprot:445120-Amphidinium_carterae.1